MCVVFSRAICAPSSTSEEKEATQTEGEEERSSTSLPSHLMQNNGRPGPGLHIKDMGTNLWHRDVLNRLQVALRQRSDEIVAAGLDWVDGGMG